MYRCYLPYFCHVGSLFKITGFPTTINRERALVTATLNLWGVSQKVADLIICKLVQISIVAVDIVKTFSFDRKPMLKSLSILT